MGHRLQTFPRKYYVNPCGEWFIWNFAWQILMWECDTAEIWSEFDLICRSLVLVLWLCLFLHFYVFIFIWSWELQKTSLYLNVLPMCCFRFLTRFCTPQELTDFKSELPRATTCFHKHFQANLLSKSKSNHGRSTTTTTTTGQTAGWGQDGTPRNPAQIS